MTVLLSGIPGNRDKEVEYVNKSVIFKAGGAQFVQGLVMTLVDLRTSDLIRMVMSDTFQSVLCSYADTTSPELFSTFIQALGDNYQALLSTLYQQTPFVLENSALLLHLLSTHAPTVAVSIREAALASGVLLHHFHAAIFSPMAGQRFLSRFLCSLWLAGPMDCDEKKLLKRMVPQGFIPYLKMPQLSRTEEEQLDVIEQDTVEENIPETVSSPLGSGLMAGSSQPTGAAGTNTARLRSRISLARVTSNVAKCDTPENFRIFFHTMTQDHSLPDLIWNQQTRRELRIGLESEIQYIHRETEARGMDKIAWNHQQFSIAYPSLETELKVGSIYMRLWLQAGDGFIRSWEDPVRLFELLFRRFLCEMDRNPKVTVMCIRCLERLYAIHGDTIGGFPDVMILIRSMASTRNTETQHRLLGLVATILGVDTDAACNESRVNVPENAEQLLNFESIEQLCQFAAWGHTNGVQVGNLMTSLLESNLPKSAMLTDGSSTKPSGSGSSFGVEPTSPVLDSCPAVWFISTTHRIPPPPATVKGPYRLKELKSMMESEEISASTLVTSSHVLSYDDDERPSDGGALDESQIDTGKWKRLDQIWQLRWQLYTDGDDSGIFTPAEVALQALRSLTRLVDLHRSVNTLGLPYLPIPIAKRIICNKANDPLAGKNGELNDSRLSFLSIIAQSILCNDAAVVDQAASLLYKLTQYNEEALSKLYLTGVFFFMACYTGSNFRSLANLIYSTHLNQHFRSGYTAAASQDELPLKDRSILGSLLPEGLLRILVNYGADKFTEVFIGTYETPEVIWNLDMRKHLIEMVRQHLGDFPKRLWQNTTTQYEYCPIPGVAYKRLEKEIFCHNYYLSKLCDENRFPNWPISEPVEVFRACLEEFKKQMCRDKNGEEQAVQGATKVLNLKPGDGSKELRKMYRKLALKYHPDRVSSVLNDLSNSSLARSRFSILNNDHPFSPPVKNPAGREMFEAVQAAYELLLPIIESGQELKFSSDNEDGHGSSTIGAFGQSADATEGFLGGRSQMETLQLLMKAQILIYKRFEQEMGKYKYPAYSQLLSCLGLTSSSRDLRIKGDTTSLFRSTFLTEKRAGFVRDVTELVFRTCLVSPLNAEELIKENGVLFLDEILDFFMYSSSILDEVPNDTHNVASDDIIFQIIANVVHTLAGIAFYESGREAIKCLPSFDRFCINWRRCIDGRYLKWRRSQPKMNFSIIQYALEGISCMARSTVLQDGLIGAGIVWPLGRFLLGYDPTLDEASVSRENIDDDVGVSQAASNTQGRLAARALGKLSGYLTDPKLSTPVNGKLQAALSIVLTGPIAILLRNKRTGEILRTLNSNVESPSRIWNIEMRAELTKMLKAVEDGRPEENLQHVETELSSISGFGYNALKNEMQIAGTYIRILNKQGQSGIKDIPNLKSFAINLTNFVASCINRSDVVPEGFSSLQTIGNGDEEPEGVLPATVPIVDRRFVMALLSLQILAKVEGVLDDILCKKDTTGLPSVLFALLYMPQDSEVSFLYLCILGSNPYPPFNHDKFCLIHDVIDPCCLCFTVLLFRHLTWALIYCP
jgi:DnaJ family protein C protein 13